MNLLNYSKLMIAKCLVLIEYLFTLEPIVQVSLGQASVIYPCWEFTPQTPPVATLTTFSTIVMSPCASQQNKAKRQRRTALARRRDNCGVLLLLPDKHTHACTQASARTHTQTKDLPENPHTLALAHRVTQQLGVLQRHAVRIAPITVSISQTKKNSKFLLELKRGAKLASRALNGSR